MFPTTQDIVGIDIACAIRLDSLTEGQAALISTSFDESWSVDRIVGCDESLALLLTPPDGIDRDIALHVAVHDGSLNLSIMQDDDLRLHGWYGASIHALVAAMRVAERVV